MLSFISWGEFAMFMLAGIAVYYGYVFAKYYRRECAALFTRKKEEPATKNQHI